MRITVEADDPELAHAAATGVSDALGLLAERLQRGGRSVPDWMTGVGLRSIAATGGQRRPTLDADTAPLVLSYRDAGAVLGVSERTIRRMVHDGRLPTVEVTGRRRIRAADVKALAD